MRLHVAQIVDGRARHAGLLQAIDPDLARVLAHDLAHRSQQAFLVGVTVGIGLVARIPGPFRMAHLDGELAEQPVVGGGDDASERTGGSRRASVASQVRTGPHR